MKSGFGGRGPKRNIRSAINLSSIKRNIFRIQNSIVNLSLNPKGEEEGFFVLAPT